MTDRRTLVMDDEEREARTARALAAGPEVDAMVDAFDHDGRLEREEPLVLDGLATGMWVERDPRVGPPLALAADARRGVRGGLLARRCGPRRREAPPRPLPLLRGRREVVMGARASRRHADRERPEDGPSWEQWAVEAGVEVAGGPGGHVARRAWREGVAPGDFARTRQGGAAALGCALLGPLDAFDKPRLLRTAGDDLEVGLCYLAALLVLVGLAVAYFKLRARAEARRLDEHRRRREGWAPR